MTATPAQATGPNLLRPLRVRDFRLLFGGESISVLGDHFHFVALAWLTLQLTGSGLALGSVLMVAAIPRTVFILLGGALSDRFSPRSLMLYSNAFRAVVVGVLAALVLTGNAELWHLFIFAAIFGVVDALFYPAVNSILPMLVDEPTLPPANALLQGSQQLAGLIGPALAGLLIASFQIGTAFVVDAISFAIAATAVFFVLGGRRAGHAEASSGGPRTTLLGTISAGLKAAWSDPAVRSLILLTAAFNFAFNGPLLVGLPFLAQSSLGGGSATFGILLSAFGAGSLLGAAGAGSVGRVRQAGHPRADDRDWDGCRFWVRRRGAECGERRRAIGRHRRRRGLRQRPYLLVAPESDGGGHARPGDEHGDARCDRACPGQLCPGGRHRRSGGSHHHVRDCRSNRGGCLAARLHMGSRRADDVCTARGGKAVAPNLSCPAVYNRPS